MDLLREKVKERHPEGLPNFFVSTEQFRPNVVLEWPEAFAEDRFFEFRVGPILMRNSGPCIRCSTIRLNLDNNCQVEDYEPYSTLASFRTVPGMGVIFGMYYQMDVLETPALYQQTLPHQLGFPTMKEALKANPVSYRKGEGEDQLYVKVRKSDGLILRHE